MQSDSYAKVLYIIIIRIIIIVIRIAIIIIRIAILIRIIIIILAAGTSWGEIISVCDLYEI